jgi:hypothetical protein
MTKNEKLLRDINGLKDSIRQQWRDLVTLPLTKEDRLAMREGIDSLTEELARLNAELLRVSRNSN